MIPELTQDLVLVGGGHTHALLLRRLAMRPVSGLRLTLINPGPTAPYSGMLPGFVAGHYPRAALDIDLVRLARFAGARLVLGAADGIDLAARAVHVPGRPPIGYDLLSLDIGIGSGLSDLPGFAEHGIAAKPLGPFADAWTALRAGTGPVNIAVIGAGLGGVELAMAMAYALRDRDGQVHLIGPATALAELSPRARRLVRKGLAARGVCWRETKATALDAQGLTLACGTHIAADFTVSAAGARPWEWLAQTGLPLEAGFVRVNRDLLVEGHEDIFAAGDCAHLTHAPRPKAGVFAVRAAPILAHNIAARCAGRPTKPFMPQRDYLKLVSLGDKSAVAEKFGLSLSHPLLWRLKDRIDRKFMRGLQDLPVMTGLNAPLCGGCGAKIGAEVLRESIASLPKQRADVIRAPGDDAALLRIGGTTQVLTCDHLRALMLDPWLFARIAARHALGDVLAMGAAPQAVLAQITLPRMAPHMQARTMGEVMAAARSVFGPAGAEIVGGHSSMGAEMSLGFTLTGLCETALRRTGAQVGDRLVMTKPLGAGVLFAAEMVGRAEGADVARLWSALDHADQSVPGARAMTDVTGFGLAGHLWGMLEGGAVAARVALGAVPLHQGALDLTRKGVRSSLFDANRSALIGHIDPSDDPRALLLFDPQTAGGMLAALPPGVPCPAGVRIIGEILPGPAHIHLVEQLP